MMTNKETVEAFIAYYASLTDEKDRKRLLARVNMAAVSAAPDEAFKPDIKSMRDYLNTPVVVPPSLVWPTIAVRGEITTTLGRAGKGKTTMNLNRIFAWAAGRPLFPGWVDKDGNEYLKPERPLRTVIAENEGNAGMFHQKCGLLLYQGPLSEEEQKLAMDNIYVHGDGGYSGLKLDNEQGVNKLRKAIEACPGGPPDILFIEPFRSLWSGEENSATDMAVVTDNIVSMATDYQMAVILSHHEKKGQGEQGDDMMSRARGSTVLEGVVAVMENFTAVKDNEYREMTWSKARYLPPPPVVRMEWNRDTQWYDWVPASAVDDAIMVCLRDADDEPMTLNDLHEATGETKSRLTPALKRLQDEKKIKRMASIASQHGSTGFRYRLPSGDSNEGGLSL